MKNKLAAITGGKGFLGKALIQRLTSLGYMYHLIEREDYYKPNFKENLEALNPSLIVHMGAYGNHSSQQDDQETFEANVVKTYLLLDATKDIPYEAFINIGSSSEYGKKSYPMREDMVPEPLTMYGGTKAAGTMLARAFAKKYNKPIATVRPFSIYGPGEAEHRFIPTVIKSLIKGEELFLDPQPYHDWTYIEDFLDGVLTVIDSIKLLQGNAINIGTGMQYRNQEVVSMLELITGLKTKILKTDIKRTDSSTWVADNKTLRLCGWKPKTKLLDGLRKTYEAYIK